MITALLVLALAAPQSVSLYRPGWREKPPTETIQLFAGSPGAPTAEQLAIVIADPKWDGVIMELPAAACRTTVETACRLLGSTRKRTEARGCRGECANGWEVTAEPRR